MDSLPPVPTARSGAPDPLVGDSPVIDPLLRERFAEPILRLLDPLVAAGSRPVLGLNGPVGAGKTTLCRWLQQQAQRRGLRLAVASIDDAYLPWPLRQRQLAGNPFGVSRVPPGSHDTELLIGCLEQWRAGGPLVLPRFDKTRRGGQGDRIGLQRLEVDALVLEGWLVGCRPLAGERLAALLAATERGSAAAGPGILNRLSAEERHWLPRWDQALQAYLPIWEQLAGLALLRPEGWSLPRRWRFQAEARQRRAGGCWLDPAALRQLVRSSLCSLPPELYQQPLEGEAALVAWLDGRRRCVRVQSGVESGVPGPVQGRVQNTEG